MNIILILILTCQNRGMNSYNSLEMIKWANECIPVQILANYNGLQSEAIHYLYLLSPCLTPYTYNHFIKGKIFHFIQFSL
jgi:hypothetical protein